MARRKKPVDEHGVPFPQPFPGYEVNARLEETIESTLWRAWDQRLDREVLLVELRPDPDREEDPAQEFFNAARTVARLRHPHLVRALDVGRAGAEGDAAEAAAEDDRFFFVTEHHRHRTAADLLAAGGAVDEETLARIALGVARALDHLFELGMVHGELTPAHLHLDADGAVRLWGLGLPLDVLAADPAARARAHPVYAAPEQFDPDAYPQHRTDLYRFGAVLYHLAAGHPPFGEDDPDVVRARLQGPEPAAPVRSHAPTCSALLAGLIGALVEKDPAARPPNAEAVLTRLDEHPAVQAIREAEAREERLRAAADPFAEENDPAEAADEDAQGDADAAADGGDDEGDGDPEDASAPADASGGDDAVADAVRSGGDASGD